MLSIYSVYVARVWVCAHALILCVTTRVPFVHKEFITKYRYMCTQSCKFF